VAVGVQGLNRAGVTEPRLDRLHALAVTDQEGGVVVPKSMQACPRREASLCGSRTPQVPEALSGYGPTIQREQQIFRTDRKRSQVTRERSCTGPTSARSSVVSAT
jgi:hypothetical protein